MSYVLAVVDRPVWQTAASAFQIRRHRLDVLDAPRSHARLGSGIGFVARTVNPGRRASPLGIPKKDAELTQTGSQREARRIHRNQLEFGHVLDTVLGASFGKPIRGGPLLDPNGAPDAAIRGREMDTLDRSQRVAVAAARDAAARARALAEGLDALVRAPDTAAVDMPARGTRPESERQPQASEHELWTAAEVAPYLKTSRSWVYQHAASGRIPCRRVGALLRFEPNEVQDWAASGQGSRT